MSYINQARSCGISDMTIVSCVCVCSWQPEVHQPNYYLCVTFESYDEVSFEIKREATIIEFHDDRPLLGLCKLENVILKEAKTL